MGKERDAILLDVGCCCESLTNVAEVTEQSTHIVLYIVGNDVRKAVADGYPAQNVITSDIEGGKEAQSVSEAARRGSLGSQHFGNLGIACSRQHTSPSRYRS